MPETRRALPLVALAVATALLSWEPLLPLGHEVRAGLLLVLFLGAVGLRAMVRRSIGPPVLLACAFAVAMGGFLSGVVGYAPALEMERGYAYMGVVLPCLALVAGSVGVALGALQVTARWWTAGALIAGISLLIATDAAAVGSTPLFPVPHLNPLPGPSVVDAAERDDMFAWFEHVGAMLLIVHSALIYPAELSTELSKEARSAPQSDSPWEVPMAWVFSLAWHWVSLLLAAGSGHARRSYEHIGDD